MKAGLNSMHPRGGAPEPLKTLALPAGLAEIDVALARLVHRLSEGDELLAQTAALVSRERGLGHVCVHLRDHAAQVVEIESQPGSSRRKSFRWPEVPDWRGRLLASKLVGDESDSRLRPLVLDGADRLYLGRYFRAERTLARGVAECARVARPADEASDELVDSLFHSLFVRDDERVADQARAARAALGGGLTLISGGPGTGKTTTVTRILVLLLAQNPELRIALAAPTGKAAARLGESIAAGLDALASQPELANTLRRVFPQVLDRVPREARTLHRLLGYRPRRDRFRYRADNPLPFDVVVVDEASMVDLLMMNALVDALPKTPPRVASLVLLGDRDQLASVEAGFVFGDLATAAGPGEEAEAAREGSMLAGSAVQLRHSWRFAARTGIGDLASAVRDGDPDRAMAVLADTAQNDVRLLRHDLRGGAEAMLRPLESPIGEYLAAEDAEDALEKLAAFRILCATRVGPWGVDRINLLVERRLSDAGHVTDERFYPRRPILVQQNDYQSGLFNGDLGICWQEGDRLRAVFPGPGGAPPRRLPLAKLPRHDTAWAMTVHKSQGSEFDRVLLILPDDPDAARGILSRELVYTGLTRARRRVDLVATEAVLRSALAKSSRRGSGLVDVLERRLDVDQTAGLV